MTKRTNHFINYNYIKNLIDNGYESGLFLFKFIDDTPNSTLVKIINKSTNEIYEARFGLSRQKDAIKATLTGINALFFWNNFGSKLYTPQIVTSLIEFESMLKYQLLEVSIPTFGNLPTKSKMQ